MRLGQMRLKIILGQNRQAVKTILLDKIYMKLENIQGTYFSWKWLIDNFK